MIFLTIAISSAGPFHYNFFILIFDLLFGLIIDLLRVYVFYVSDYICGFERKI